MLEYFFSHLLAGLAGSLVVYWFMNKNRDDAYKKGKADMHAKLYGSPKACKEASDKINRIVRYYDSLYERGDKNE